MKEKAGRRELESILFVTDRPLSLSKLASLLELEKEEVEKLIKEIKRELEKRNAGFLLKKRAGGYRFYTNPSSAPYVEKLISTVQLRKLTQAALETLAIVAYKQPVTKSEINAIRGVNSEATLQTLIEKGLIKEVGRKEGPGQPILYGTTRKFLEMVGIEDLSELPSWESFKGERKERETPESSG
jgi:segregation and condensation protein B